MSPFINEDPERKLQKIKCFALDMDGTFYLGDRLLNGSLSFIRRLEETGRKFIFLTNNSSKSGLSYISKLKRLGLSITERQLVTSGQATINYLKSHYAGKSIFLLGNPVLQEEFLASGIRLEEQYPEVIVTAFDTTLDYEKLCKLCNHVRAGLPYIATHPDFNCPIENGFIPDIGAIHAFVKASTGRMPDKVIGKPNREIMDFSCMKTRCSPSETAIVGDRLYTDIAIAENVPELTSILVLTGETAMEDLSISTIQPDFVFTSLADVTPFL